MDESPEVNAARKLFFEYADALNEEFHDDESTAHMQEKCLALGNELLELGFWILARCLQVIESNQLPDGLRQSVILLKHEMILVRKDAPRYEPLAKAMPVSKIFGKPIVPQAPLEHISVPVSEKSEKDKIWLESILNSLGPWEGRSDPSEDDGI
ncbi:MAG: hypothetical protein U1A25_01705 [Candidatus Sungbacteria bacterium]|nr:hypothetical protein [bacterium]MDZ4260356.1 hypothetical protein [Candidatus Sungbacteria bacterium]